MPARRSPSLFLALALVAMPLRAAGPVELLPAKNGSPGTVYLQLDPDFAPSWRQVNAGRLVLRTPGLQRRLKAAADGERLAVEVGEDGCALLLIDLGPAYLKGRPDAWRQVTRATKILTCSTAGGAAEQLAARRAAGAMVTAKTGSRIELRPLANPALLRAGADLPLIAYLEGAAQAGVEVVAIAPDGSRRYRRTDAVGAAVVAIDLSGRWTIEYRQPRRRGEDLAASLVFDVPPPAFWQALGLTR